MMPGKIIPPATLRARRYRLRHRRIDYVPAPDVMSIIEHHREIKPDCVAGIIDKLLRLGHKAVAGNAEAQ